MVHYDGVEKSTNPGYPGPTTDGEEAPADVHHAATVSGPCISCLIAKRVAFSFYSVRTGSRTPDLQDAQLPPYHCATRTFSLRINEKLGGGHPQVSSFFIWCTMMAILIA